MKATIASDGTLRIIPENEVEAYALQCWIAEQHSDHPNVLHCLSWREVIERTQLNKSTADSAGTGYVPDA